MSVQNPTIPTPTDPKGIDLVVSDLQTLLDTSLVWLTNGMGRAYRLTKVRTNDTTVFLPEVYLGVANRYDYFAATPDNDKQGQNIFFVGDATLPDQQKGFYGWVEHEVGIIFSANLETINSTLLATEDFTEHLIQDVREVLIRDLVGKSYRVNIDSITREFDDVYAEFDVARDRGIAHAPMTHFRFNCTVTFREDCTGVSLNRCAAILQNLSQDDLLNCILPTYDFSNTLTQTSLTSQQVTDLTDWLCVAPNTPASFVFDGVNESLFLPISTSYDFEYNDPFSVNLWVKFNTLLSAQLFSKFDAGTNTGITFLVFNTGYFLFQLSNGSNIRRIQSNPSVVTTGVWYMITIGYDGVGASGMYIAINGVKIATSIIVDTLGTNTILNSGNCRFMGNTLFADGLLNSFRIWDVDLTNTNLLNEYNSGTPLEIPEQNANCVLNVEGAKDAIYGVTNFVAPDLSNTITGVQSTNMESTDKTSDVPT